MYYKFVMWLVKRMSNVQKKAVVLGLLDGIVQDRYTSIDKAFGEQVVKMVIKSTGNEITAFIVKG